jgi:hypothetical protein
MRAAADSVAARVTEPRWQSCAPVFHSVPAPRAAALLAGLAAAHEAEAAAKRGLATALPQSLPGCGGGGGGGESECNRAISGGGGSGGGGGAPGDPEALRERLTAAIAAWLSRPFVDDERAELVLGALTEDMAGF